MSGYDGPTADPWDAIKQRQQREHEAAQEANRPGRTQTFQSVRKLWNAILDIQVQQEALQDQQDQLAAVVASIPLTASVESIGGGFTPSSSWATVASVNIPRPAGKGSAQVMAVANSSINWASSGGVAWPVVSTRVVINGSAGPAAPMGQGVSVADSSVSGRASGASMRARSVPGTSNITVQLQVAITGWIGDGAQGQASFSGGVPQIAASVTFAP